jgi:prefoldin subunit 5
MTLEQEVRPLKTQVADLNLQVKSLQQIVERLTHLELARQGKTGVIDHNSSIFSLASKGKR